METSLKTGFAQIFSRCPKNLSCPKFGGAAAPLAPPARTPMSGKEARTRVSNQNNFSCILEHVNGELSMNPNDHCLINNLDWVTIQFSIVAIHSSKFGSVNHYPGYQRFFSRAAGIFGVAEGQHIFSHYKDLTETRNRARKVSGTQGIKSLITSFHGSNIFCVLFLHFFRSAISSSNSSERHDHYCPSSLFSRQVYHRSSSFPSKYNIEPVAYCENFPNMVRNEELAGQ